MIKNYMTENKKVLSKYGTKDTDVIRFKIDSEDIRPAFFRDIDRIIHSLSYTRYLDKTQVFTFNENDNITRRMIHVQLVSKIARTIGRALGLNEDLIEAASLGHDLGHVPFGHEGEYILNRISQEHNEGYFNHNIQSVRDLLYVENNGKGLNISLQVLDAIMCHNGEFLQGTYEPTKKTKEQFFDEYNETYHNKNKVLELIPMTLEGCVVRISDLIGYLGRDIEDAIRLGLIKKEQLPKEITNILGSTNSDIINTIVLDIIANSFDKPYIKLSDKVYNAVKLLKDFNYKYIYAKANTKEDLIYYEKIFRTLFDKYLNDLKNKNTKSSIYEYYLKDIDKSYLKDITNERIIIDFIAGMTDDFIKNEYEQLKNN